jgi:hypothetical protein
LAETRDQPLQLRLDQVPEIAVEIGEHRNRAVGFMARLFLEKHALRQHRLVVAGEIIRLQEQKDAAASLVADA